MRTSDGGSNWFEQYRGVGVLNSIFFVNDQLGWAVGKNGTILYTPNGGLPVELVNFTADIIDNDVILNWTTATETNNLGFAIERKHNKADWRKIGFVPGHGTTTEPQFYSFDDESVLLGVYQYRLKQIDYNGTFEYSEIIEMEVGIPTEFSLSQNYPNPFNPITTIRFTISDVRFTSLKVYDVLGNEIATLVNEEKPPGSYEVEWNASDFPSGIYFYRLTASTYSVTKKMILLK